MTPQAQALLERIERDLARDLRNQRMIDRMRHGNWKGSILGRINRHPFAYGIMGSLVLWALILTGISQAIADELHVPCPTPGQPCKVLLLSQQEENVLMQQNGVLDTAAQARALELGQFSVYLKTRIASAPAGEVKPLEQPKIPTGPGLIQPPQAAQSPAIPTPGPMSVENPAAKE